MRADYAGYVCLLFAEAIIAAVKAALFNFLAGLQVSGSVHGIAGH